MTKAAKHDSTLAAPPPQGDEAPPPVRSLHPDVELLRSWTEYLFVCRALEAITPEALDQDDHPYWRLHDEAVERLLDTPAVTPAGIAVKLRWLFVAVSEGRAAYDVIIHDAPFIEEIFADDCHRLLWQLISDAERMGVAA